MMNNIRAGAVDASPQTKDEGPAIAAPAQQKNEQDESPDCHGAPHSGQALRTIEGELKASAYLARLHAQQANPDELALMVSMLYGATLRGFCRAIEKAMGAYHA